jgi:subtilase family serine protease
VSASSSFGAGKTIAIVDAYDDPNAAADLATYRSNMGLPPIATSNCTLTSISPCFVKVNQNGVAGSYPQANGGWAQEISLDLDMASAICPNCNILLVEASSASFINLGTSVKTAAGLGAVAISNSYGSSGDASDKSYGQYYNHPGIAVTASTGDSGYGVGYPATSDFTVAVGGTTLSTDSSSRSWSESAWSGAGSGCSTYQSQPNWQASAVGNACGTKRAIADVSADANPNTGVAVYDSYSYGGASGWLQFGGTSVSSPIIASVYALAKGTGASWPNYPAALPYGDTAALYDATGGSNGSCTPSVLCTGGNGWDGPTGLGTPNGLAAFGGSSGGGTPPSAPSNLVGSVSGSTVTLNWTIASDAASYNVYRDTVKIGSPTTASYSDTVPNGTYSYYVTAVNSSGQESVPSNTVSVTVSASSVTAPSFTYKSCSGGATCTFTATGSAPLTWGGATGTGFTATTTYTSPGNYAVTVSNSYGSASTPVSCVWNGHGRNKALSCS